MLLECGRMTHFGICQGPMLIREYFNRENRQFQHRLHSYASENVLIWILNSIQQSGADSITHNQELAFRIKIKTRDHVGQMTDCHQLYCGFIVFRLNIHLIYNEYQCTYLYNLLINTGATKTPWGWGEVFLLIEINLD